MPAVAVGDLTFTIPEDWIAEKYDDWKHYRHQFIRVCNSVKAVDLLIIESSNKCCWLVEVKDYRKKPRVKVIDLADEIAAKVRDSIAGLVAAKFRANDHSEMTAARRALVAADLRIVLHLEQPTKSSRLFPRAIDPADVQQKLRQLLEAIDPRARVVEREAMRGIPWTVS